MEYEDYIDTNCNLCVRYNPQRTRKATASLGSKRTNGDHLDYSIIKIIGNTEKSPGNLRRLAVSRTPVENHQLMRV